MALSAFCLSVSPVDQGDECFAKLRGSEVVGFSYVMVQAWY